MSSKADPNEDIIIYHPVIKKTSTVARYQYEDVYKERGWTDEVPPKAAKAEVQHQEEVTGNPPVA